VFETIINTVRSLLYLIALSLGSGLLAIAGTAAQEPEVALFKSAVERVAVAAIVRDSKGRLVKNLGARDFELLDDGRPRPLTGVWSEASPASVAILMDASGSMATKMGQARETAQGLVAGLKPGVDEVALFAFDTTLQQVRPFSTAFSSTDEAWDTTKAYGATSLWDAIANTAQQISDRQRRRALVVITDGVDSASKLKPSDVSAIASALDVPVYILVITFALEEDDQPEFPAIRGPLADLAAWTGGDSLLVRDPLTSAVATRQILSELHHQYVVAFEPGTALGWHPVLLRARKPGLFVRARSGYMVK
jgi:Ca-activated chloride channel family protein